jgi:hypothetical protein
MVVGRVCESVRKYVLLRDSMSMREIARAIMTNCDTLQDGVRDYV